MRTLVLNAGYEPVSVVSDRRALLLVATGKASVLEDGDAPMHSPTRAWGRPLVILLHQYVRVPHADAAAVSRKGVLRRDGHRCAYCGAHATTVDHVHPRSRGGQNTWENLVACCLRCNSAKADRSLDALGWRLRVVPTRPCGVQWRLRELERPAPAWEGWLQLAA
ncbi:HNH endonuclease [Micrococcus sp. ACRRV]|uniref:HNH endonuclease n=1 Tax=Micrococcus TaxID=1269 RepID=UPI001EF32C1E|nr:HNH endonuclease [Micrococcus sp. ACRRV]MCG7422236.1 HNH endonuclease [Micrococcus sp. ACRRV]